VATTIEMVIDGYLPNSLQAELANLQVFFMIFGLFDRFFDK